jgi:PrcB C-terminal
LPPLTACGVPGSRRAGGMARIAIRVMVVAATALAGCGRDKIPKAQPPQKEAKAAAREAPPPPRAVTGYFFAPATPAAGDVPATEYSHSCQSDIGGLKRDPVPLGGPMRSMGRPPVLYHDTVSLLSLPLRCVIQNKDDWTEVRILGSLRLPRTFKGVSFGRETVLLAGLGPQPTAGYDVRFDSLTMRNDTLFAFVGRARPPSGAVLTAGGTSPVEVLRIPKHTGPVVFVEQ